MPGSLGLGSSLLHATTVNNIAAASNPATSRFLRTGIGLTYLSGAAHTGAFDLATFASEDRLRTTVHSHCRPFRVLTGSRRARLDPTVGRIRGRGLRPRSRSRS